MELCSLTLSEWLQDRNAQLKDHSDYAVVQEKDNERIMKQLLQALAKIHSHDLIHRDVKVSKTLLSG